MDSLEKQQPQSFEEVILQIASTLPPGYPKDIPLRVERKFRRALKELAHTYGPAGAVQELQLFLESCVGLVLRDHDDTLKSRREKITDLPTPDPFQAAVPKHFWAAVERMITISAMTNWRSSLHASKPQPPDSNTAAGILWRQPAMSDVGKRFDLHEIDTVEAVARTRKLLDPKKQERRNRKK